MTENVNILPIRVSMRIASDREAVNLKAAQDREAVPFGVETKIVAGNAPEYAGEYEATPLTQEQIFETSGKVMRKNVTFHAVPWLEVENSSGGTTVTIGG